MTSEQAEHLINLLFWTNFILSVGVVLVVLVLIGIGSDISDIGKEKAPAKDPFAEANREAYMTLRRSSLEMP